MQGNRYRVRETMGQKWAPVPHQGMVRAFDGVGRGKNRVSRGLMIVHYFLSSSLGLRL